jgi:acetyl esterase
VEGLRRGALRSNEIMLPILNADLPQTGRFDPAVLICASEEQDLSAEVALPIGEGPFPVVVYLHGGGYVMGSAELDRSVAFRFVQAGYAVVSVNYRLAPEHPFPAGFDDAAQAVSWARAHAHQWSFDSERVVIAGCSAGAGLAASVIATSAPGAFRAAVLMYGGSDGRAPTEPPETAEMFRAMMRAYLGNLEPGDLENDPRLRPILEADRFPPTFVGVGEFDPFLPSCQRLADGLGKSGVRHQFEVLRGHGHGFLPYYRFIPEVAGMFDEIIRFIDAASGR